MERWLQALIGRDLAAISGLRTYMTGPKAKCVVSQLIPRSREGSRDQRIWGRATALLAIYDLLLDQVKKKSTYERKEISLPSIKIYLAHP
jgi:hypothetical protein